jgi:hypothetical protein
MPRRAPWEPAVRPGATAVDPSPARPLLTRQLSNLTGAGAMGGAFWGFLFGLIFLAEPTRHDLTRRAPTRGRHFDL